MQNIIGFSDSDFRLKTQIQLVKDFAQHGFDFPVDFSEFAWDSGSILDEVVHLIGLILEKNANQWMSLIYTIDLSEKTYQQFLVKADKDSLRELAWLIIKREAQKVYLRSLYW